MNRPFELSLSVREINRTEETQAYHLEDQYKINVTLEHNIYSLLHLIWLFSADRSLKPMLLKIYYQERRIYGPERLCDVLDTSEVPTDISEDDFVLEVDYEMFDHPSLGVAEPVEDLFDLEVRWNDFHGRIHTLRYREGLLFEVRTLKDYIIQDSERYANSRMIDQGSLTVKLQPSGKILDDLFNMRRNLGLDVTPLHPVAIEVQISFNTRFHIKVESNISQLQEESSLFEVNNGTTVSELRRQIIARLDQFSVRRTFEDELIMFYQELALTGTGNLMLELGTRPTQAQNKIYKIRVDTSSTVSGSNGLLSREFLNDLRGPNRFEFLPRRPAQQNGSVQPEQPILPIDPTRIVFENGVEWNLAGETYERIRPNPNTLTTTERNQQELLVDQSDISSLDYEFSLKIEDQVKLVSLNTSQCIIVDKGDHTPYLLLNPSGAAKLCLHFGLPNGDALIQQVQVLMYEPANRPGNASNQPPSVPTPLPTPTTNNSTGTSGNSAPRPSADGATAALVRVFNLLFVGYEAPGNRAVLFVLKSLLVMKLLGIELPLEVWKIVIAYGVVGTLLYLTIFKGTEIAASIEEHFPENNQVRQPWVIRPILVLGKVMRFTSRATSGVSRSIGNEVIHVLVARTRDFEYILDSRQGGAWSRWWYRVRDGGANAWKDALMWGVTFLPDWDQRIVELTEAWRKDEMAELERRVDLEAQL
ncbi:uncharacterized protein CANTADRAFT_33357, partial [Suhomyces tanzawaensis NRRL Y-17324]